MRGFTATFTNVYVDSCELVRRSYIHVDSISITLLNRLMLNIRDPKIISNVGRLPSPTTQRTARETVPTFTTVFPVTNGYDGSGFLACEEEDHWTTWLNSDENGNRIAPCERNSAHVLVDIELVARTASQPAAESAGSGWESSSTKKSRSHGTTDESDCTMCEYLPSVPYQST